MYCPQCKAEYRAGFTRCADCDVELVRELAPSPDAELDKDPFCQFWRGEDPRVFAELREVLGGAGIPYRTAELLEHAFNLMRFPEFRLAVPFSKFEQAEQAVAEAYGNAEEADNAMYPSVENREGYRELISWTHEEKWKQRGRGAPEMKDDEAKETAKEE
jgi:hypothetical protein